MFVPSHFKSCHHSRWCSFHTNPKNLPLNELSAEEIIYKLELKSNPLTSRIRPLAREHHPFKQLNKIMRQAIASQNIEMVETILSQITSEAFEKHVIANTLPLAVETGSHDIVKLLLWYRANVNARYGSNQSEREYQDDTVEDYEENRGPTALLFASMFDEIEIAETLIDYKANVNLSADFLKKDHKQFMFHSNVTPLHLAALNGNAKLIRTYINHNANPNALNGFDENPLFMAAWKGNIRSIEILLGHGANPKQQNKRGAFPVDCARSEEIKKLLNQE